MVAKSINSPKFIMSKRLFFNLKPVRFCNSRAISTSMPLTFSKPLSTITKEGNSPVQARDYCLNDIKTNRTTNVYLQNFLALIVYSRAENLKNQAKLNNATPSIGAYLK